MPSACIPGRLAQLQVSGDAGTTYVNLGGIVDVKMNVKIDELETTSHDSSGSREYIPNFLAVEFDVNCRWEDGDPGQEFVVQAVFAHTTFPFIFTMETVSQRKQWTGSAFATAMSPDGPLDGVGGLSFTLRASGVLMSTQ